MTTQKPLLIYSASAGSGKTYTLVKTYLELILKGDVNPKNFSKIIAMTFTNKAALEMKTRIVDALSDLSQPKRHLDIKKQDKAIQYGKDIALEFLTTPEELKRKAHIALTHILHQYEDFFVMTIDKFNLRLIRSFAVDLDIEANFKVVIDETEIKQRVVDDFLDEIDPNVSNLLSKIFIQLASNRIEDEKSWNFENDLKEYLNILNKEDTIELLNQVDDIPDISEFTNSLKTQINFFKEKLNENAKPYLQKIEPLLSTSDLNKQKTNAINNLNLKLKNNESDIYSVDNKSFDTVKKYLNEDTLPDYLHQPIENFVTQHFTLLGEIEKIKKVKDSFLYIRLLRKVNERLKDFRKTEQIIRISEFNQMISDLLKNEEAPYIYEKLGTRYNHFLLDEFQDTSRLQWQNIVPLVHESISHQHKNLIVGDPKQSIYRFRGGIADQFVALPAIYNPTNDAHFTTLSRYFEKMGVKDELKDNYRSSKDIVEFNNLFFSKFIQFIKNKEENAQDYSAYYDKIKQNPKNDKQGFIEIVSIHNPAKSKKDLLNDDGQDDDEIAAAENIQYLLQCVNACIEDGYEKGDICVLGDTAKLCNSYALALTEKGHKVVSSDSLAVNSDKSVKLCLMYLNWRNQPSNELLAKQFIEYYFSMKQPLIATELYKSYFKEKTSSKDSDKQFTYFDYKQFVIDSFGKWDEFHFPFENLYTLLERLYKILDLNELKSPYLHHLSDLAFNYDLNNGPDLSAFIAYYKNKGNVSSIQTPENNDAIKIMTSHKSKGLEFKIVIIPQLDKTFLNPTSSYLVKLDKQLAYTKISNSSKSEELQAKYQEEYKAALLDKLNLCYVAFTRPINRLYVMSFFKKKSQTSFGHEFIHSFLQTSTFENNTVLSEGNDKEGRRIVIQFGERIKQEKNSNHSNQDTNSEFSPSDISDKLWFPEISLKHHLDNQEEGIDEQRRYGTQLHLLLSELDYFGSISEIIVAFEKKGLIEAAFIPNLQKDLERITTDETYQILHKNYTHIINEQAIIISEKDVKRPDKIIIKDDKTIVIDYKTGLKSNSHQKQVKTYCDILKDMEFPNVQGYVLYTQDLQFVSCH